MARPYAVQERGGSLMVTIDPDVVEKLNLHPGEFVAWEGARIVKVELP